ncbi:flagellin [Clostridium algidicarnis]|uniref:Flagellin n=1 Tax=Clostridium algidicarnis TaxID=37659 RepID=A0ABS6C618_9CLOT|nr:flagellin [Clostridium algidicarnis]MBU3220932.1 hypothetical protein [Clostridium algidicarnis]
MIIQHNSMSMVTSNKLKSNTKKQANIMEKLSSGLRINRASDDAAGLSISEKMKGQIRGLSRAAQNIQDGSSYVQVADGALTEVGNMLQRMRELTIQAANDTYVNKSDRESINIEFQELKEEIDNIFENTEFNSIKIWDTNIENKVQIGTEQKQAVKMNSSYESYKITDINKGATCYSEYKMNVISTNPLDNENYGITVNWTGYNGNDYTTSIISWDKLSTSNVNFNISDYLDVINNPELEDISLGISYTVTETATVDDIAKALNGVSISAHPNTTESISNSSSNSDISLSLSTNYLAELASGRLMDVYDTNFIEPNLLGPKSNVIIPDYSANPIDSSGWTLSFNMQNIGTVTASCNDLHYYSNDASDNVEGKWWRYSTNETNKYKVTIPYSPSIDGTGLNSVLSCLSRDDGYSITKDANANGNIILKFNLTSDSPFEYGGNSSNNVGSMTVIIKVGDDDTEEDLLNKIKASFNENSEVDVFAGSKSDGSPYNSYVSSGYASAKTSIIDIPIYKAVHDVAIQAGANSCEQIHIVYDSLRTSDLGITDTNVITRENTSKAIGDIDNALVVVTNQRTLFGSYENRLQHSYSNNMNAAEKLQSSESKLRDLDISDSVVQLSKYNILEQTNLILTSQANISKQRVLELLK